MKILVNKNNKTLVPESLQQHAMEWHHANSMHPGLICTESTARQHLHWKMSREDMQKHILRCNACQQLKKRQTKCGLSPEKEAETMPWEQLCMDAVGAYEIKRKNKKH